MGYAKEKEEVSVPRSIGKGKRKEKERYPITQNKRLSHVERGASSIQKIPHTCTS